MRTVPQNLMRSMLKIVHNQERDEAARVIRSRVDHSKIKFRPSSETHAKDTDANRMY